ncbi:hypothetical protein P3X46_029965 [Hevea brasiliensis]|uniref:AP2/ERF domain-containing protein n=1 Tax=Hevea brasiliensis TaxID=3981 RepID=A0ABQ9KUR7_HEVBR|nr:dehydration-responsive element-binding protein 1E-like [Hevea brasiliensis]KAJ9147849.1 hypothetical protein P3X46_029965 [Hevea brasiliensis]
MDISGHFSDPQSFDTRQESSLLSDASSTGGKAHSDEEVLLATSRPKRRSGRRIFSETRHPVFRGVRKRNGNRWVCELREPNKKSRLWLGTYPTPEMAATAHDVAALALRGKSACLNFADSAWRLPVPASRDAREIRRAAKEAAELFPTPEFQGDDLITVKRSSVIEDSSEASRDALYIDEDEVFNMPRLLVDMAQGLLLSPPHFEADGTEWNSLETDVDISLWSY